MDRQSLHIAGSGIFEQSWSKLVDKAFPHAVLPFWHSSQIGSADVHHTSNRRKFHAYFIAPGSKSKLCIAFLLAESVIMHRGIWLQPSPRAGPQPLYCITWAWVYILVQYQSKWCFSIMKGVCSYEGKSVLIGYLSGFWQVMFYLCVCGGSTIRGAFLTRAYKLTVLLHITYLPCALHPSQCIVNT